MNPRWKGLFGATLLGASLLGCADDGKDYAGLEFDVQSAPPVLLSIQPDRIELVAGVAVQVAVEPLSSGERYGSRDLVTLRAGPEDVFEVYLGQAEREFVLVGLRAGDSCLNVSINGEAEECIPVQVRAEPR